MKKIEIGGYRVLIESKRERKKIAQRAAQIKSERAQEKIKQAIKELQAEGKKITPYRVAKKAGVSYNTARKYLS